MGEALSMERGVVAKGGIEPPTQGFSVLCLVGGGGLRLFLASLKKLRFQFRNTPFDR